MIYTRKRSSSFLRIYILRKSRNIHVNVSAAALIGLTNMQLQVKYKLCIKKQIVHAFFRLGDTVDYLQAIYL
jgi:hypothetical protein